MCTMTLPSILSITASEFQVDERSRSDLGLILSVTFLLPRETVSIEGMNLWLDMNQLKDILTKIKSADFHEIEVSDLSRKISILVSSDGLRAKIKLSVFRPITRDGT